MGDSDQAASLSPLRPPGHVSQDTMSLGDTLMQLPRMIRALGVVKDCHTASRCVALFFALGTRPPKPSMPRDGMHWCGLDVGRGSGSELRILLYRAD